MKINKSNLFHPTFKLQTAAVLVTTLLLGCETANTSDPQKYSGHEASQKILFLSTSDGDQEIYVTSFDGKTTEQLTHNNANDTQAVWSADGSKIAYSSNRDGNYEIYVMNSDGSEQVRLTEHPAMDSDPRWSPDGSKIAFISYRDNKPGLFLMDANGKNVIALGGALSDVVDPQWSPDGIHILVSAVTARKQSELVLVNSKTGAVERLISEPKTRNFHARYSPSGDQLVFVSIRKRHMDIYLYELGTKKLVKLTDDAVVDAAPAWSPSGESILFHSMRSDPMKTRQDIFLMDIQKGTTVNLSNDPSEDWQASWGSTGSWISFVSFRSGGTKLFRYDLEEKTVTQISHGKGMVSQPLSRPVL